MVATLFALTALANFLARYETPEAWEKAKVEHPRLAAVMSFLRAVGVDPVKAVRALTSFIRGRWGGPPPPPSPPPPPAVLAVAALAMFALSCGPVVTRAQARSAIVMMAEGVKEADKVCANVARSLPPDEWLTLAERCAKSYHAARRALEDAELKIDTMDSAPAPFWCAAGDAASAIGAVVGAIGSRAALSAPLQDAQLFAATVSAVATKLCKERP